jgi:KAP family P-loop domain
MKEATKRARNAMDYAQWKIILDLPSSQPKLGFDRFSQAFRDIIVNSEPRFAIGIFGGWGSGKTTLMDGVRRELSKSNPQNVISVDFSAWRYEKEDHLIVPLLDSIRESLLDWQKQHRKFRKIAAETAQVIGGVTQSIVSGLGFKVGLPGALELSFDANKSLKTAAELDRSEELESVPRSFYYASFDALRKAFERFASTDRQRRIVVFIDDLDRCLPQGALQVIESMKLFFDLPGFVFVVGLDRQVVEWCIDVNYRNAAGQAVSINTEGYQIRGADYVKKIFQVPFTLSPVSTTQIDQYLDATFLEASLPQSQQDEIKNIIRPHLNYLVTRNGINPREIKRYVNAYTLTMKTKPQDKVFNPDVVLAIQTMAFTPEWQLAYDALVGSRINFINALHARINGNYQALSNLDPNLAAIPSRLLEYVSQNEPGASLLTTPNINDYIHLGAAALDSDTLLVSRELLDAIGRFRDLRQETLRAAPKEGPVDSLQAKSAREQVKELSSAFVSHMQQSTKTNFVQQGMERLRASLDAIADAAGRTGAPRAPDGWTEGVNRQFDEVLSLLSDYLREGRARRASKA